MMEEDLVINVGDFSHFPSGRDAQDGDYNGTRFREEYLVPAIRAAVTHGKKVIVDFNDVESMGSSFLDEAFGGLVKWNKIDKSIIKQVLRVTTDRPNHARHIDAVWRYIERAKL